MTFDPFESRLCRDIRNTIGHGFIKSLQNGSIKTFSSDIQKFESLKTPSVIKHYIHHRQACLEKISKQIKTLPGDHDHFFEIANLLWSHELYFEVHEWLEEKWMSSKGDEKKSIQALILSAIAYEQLTYNRKSPAQKVAAKAIVLLKEYRTAIPNPFDPDILIGSLLNLELNSPRVNAYKTGTEFEN